MLSPKELDMMIASALKHAPVLRAAGVLRLDIDDFSMELAPAEPDHGDVEGDARKDDQPKSIWDDRDLYGRPQDATVPGIKKEK